jgi:hypothetical protein
MDTKTIAKIILVKDPTINTNGSTFVRKVEITIDRKRVMNVVDTIIKIDTTNKGKFMSKVS